MDTTNAEDNTLMKKVIDKLFPEELIRLLQTAYWVVRLLRIVQQT